MIGAAGPFVAHLGGPRGDCLSIARDGGEFLIVAELGWQARDQVTPQRRLLATADALFVLEPGEGWFLRPPFRARRFDWSGRELGALEGDGEPDETASLCYFAEREGARVRFVHGGIDPATGAPLRFEQTVETDYVRRTGIGWGRPLRNAGAWLYPVLGEGLLRVRDGAVERAWRGDPGPVERLGERVVCLDREGYWADGEYHRVAGAPLYPRFCAPLSGGVARHGANGFAILRRGGGELPVHEAPPARLPAGRYLALVDLPTGLFGLAAGSPPELVPAGP